MTRLRTPFVAAVVVAVVAALLPAGASPALAQDGPAADPPADPFADTDLHEVVLDTEDAIVRIPVTLERPALLWCETFFPPPELGDVDWHFENTAGETVALHDAFLRRVTPPGDYELVVRADGTSDRPLVLRVIRDAPHDPHEPNDSAEQATEVTLPARVSCVLEHIGHNPDWFRFEVPRAGILGIWPDQDGDTQLNAVLSGPGGENLFVADGNWELAGARYVRVQPGEHLLKIGTQFNERTHVRLHLTLYEPGGDPARAAGGVIGVDFEEGPELDQLRLIAEAAGLPMINAADADSMLEEMSRTVEAPPPADDAEDEERGGGGAVLWLLAIAGLVILAVMILRIPPSEGGAEHH